MSWDHYMLDAIALKACGSQNHNNVYCCCCSSVVIDDDQETSRYMRPAVTDEADVCAKGSTTDETHVFSWILDLGIGSGFAQLTFLLCSTYPA